MIDLNNIKDDEFKNEEGQFFAKYITDVENTLSKNQKNNFASLKTNEERIRFVYNLDVIKKLELPKFNFGKNGKKALEFKEIGNKFYGQNQFGKAAKMYWNGLLECPASEGELMSVLHANRSACLYNMQEYESALEDITVAFDLPYPKNIHHKLYERRAKCYMALEDKVSALDAFKKALTSLDDAKLDTSAKMKKSNDFTIMIELLLKSLKTLGTSAQTNKKAPSKSARMPNVPQLSKDRNRNYPSASNLVEFDSNPNDGRFAVAAEPIEAGDVILVEPAHCATLIFEYSRTHCQHCFCRVTNPFSCTLCTSVVFCSLKCREQAVKTYHKYECLFHGSLLTEGASITCNLAIRLITQKGLKYFQNIKQKLQKLDGTLPKEKYDPSDYSTVYNLCTHSDRRSTNDFLQRSIMSVVLLQFLQKSNFFGDQIENSKFSENEEYIGGLLLHNLQLLQFNAHEISELQFNSEYPGDINKAKSTFIAGGLFPTLALFNHSCEPGIARYFSGSKVIVRAVKPIASGEIIAENYGPIYTQVKRESRKAQLKTRYWFDCSCIPCQQNWPLFESMNMDVLPFKCTERICPGYIKIGASTEDFTFNCPVCKASICIFPGLRSLNETEELFKRGERIMSEQKYLDALQIFLRVIKILGSTLRPPFRDFCLCQQKIRSCMLTLGNKIQLQK